MLWIGLCIGFALGMGVGVILSDTLGVLLEIKRLDREVQADLLECAKQERLAAALRAIAENERQAQESED